MKSLFPCKKLLPLAAAMLTMSSAWSATLINLNHQSPRALGKLFTTPTFANQMQLQEVNREVDFNQTLHVRVKETYQGFPVWGADAVFHLPQSADTKAAWSQLLIHGASANGKVYQHLATDLGVPPAYLLSDSQKQKAVQAAIFAYQQTMGGKSSVRGEEASLMVYVDQENKAHWAYQVNFSAAPLNPKTGPEKPITIMDAVTLQVYHQWNNLQTLTPVYGGGFGGNKKMGKSTYDGLSGHLTKLSILREPATNTCYLQNTEVTVKRCTEFDTDYDECTASVDFSQTCLKTDADHNGVYWNGEVDATHGGYSPSNDALYVGGVIKSMYQTWYQLPVLMKDNKPMMLNMIVHTDMDNAYWNGSEMVFGDGHSMLYPLTTVEIGAHEVSHGFTQQHSGLIYEHQSGGMNESFSDMASKAAVYFATGSNTWKIGTEVMIEGDALRYMDQPSKDCGGFNRGCSIDDASQYNDSLNVHYSSGVYNRAFYLIATSAGWDTKKAFDVMVQANRYYWTPTVTFKEGACGVIRATRDYGYDGDTVLKAFATVKVDTSEC